MPRPARRPSPITLPHYPMDTLWEVDESLESSQQLRSVFEDDDDEPVAFPLPPRSLPAMKRLFSPRMGLSIRSASRTRPPTKAPPKPTRAPPPAPRPVSPLILITRPVSPSSSASSSDTEPPRTPPAAPAPLPSYVPPAEWESAIDALFEFEDEEEVVLPKRSTPTIILPTDSYLSFSPPSSPPPMHYTQSVNSPLPPSMAVYASDSLPMSPTFSRPLASPGLIPTSPTSPTQMSWPVPARPARSSRRMGSIPVRFES
ncbi:hypothetical protein RSOLAG1IB_05136 [Rhizoctonia solani AG-1 IB]|uniref:Uncharacterized protein n=1 Tax=Thanatephorus cucumeris (strain AG1-IB / isolate 7/3/14) TaxID=1108050 RepID=A0A0B7FYV6_THACB|nr:hypothetical protein RSOLAG1IB_05136 [Rhizoctonia solani AG-1 IB]